MINISITSKIQFFLQLETFSFFAIFLLLSFSFYKIFLKGIGSKRHTNLKDRFLKTTIYLVISAVSATLHWIVYENATGPVANMAAYYTAIVSLFAGAIVVVKSSQILAYLILFYQNISQGIPRLIVNLLTVIVSIVVVTYLASEILAIHLTTMLATSAVFSLVLGLALQDTLGNLFSGVAMQIGQPYKIGDWVEINTDSKKWLGQIQEITWRATFISTFADEWLMIPNKTIAQSQIIILSNTYKPVRQSLTFRFSFDQNINQAKQILTDAVQAIPGIMTDPAVRPLVTETTESWITLKIFYSIDDFSLKYRIADQAFEKCIEALRRSNVHLESNRIKIQNT